MPILMSEDDDRVPTLCDALKTLVLSNQQFLKGTKNSGAIEVDAHSSCLFPSTPNRLTPSEAEANLHFLQSHVQRILPVLFTKYVSMGVQANAVPSNTDSTNNAILLNTQRMRVHAAIEAWVSIAKSEVTAQLFEVILKKYLVVQKEHKENVAGSVVQQRLPLLDLANILLTGSVAAFIPGTQLRILLQLVLQNIKESDGPLQKKSYRSLSLLCSPQLMPSPQNDAAQIGDASDFLFNDNFIKELMESLEASVECTLPAGKRDRTLFIGHLVERLPSSSVLLLQCIPPLLSEIVISTKETAEAIRLAAFNCFIQMAQKMQRCHPPQHASSDDVDASLDEFATMVVAGLAGKTALMISATIHCLARLLYEYRSNRGSSLQSASLDIEAATNPTPDNLDTLIKAETDATASTTSPLTLSLTMVRDIVRSVLIYVRLSKSREIIKASIGFIKVVVISFPHLLVDKMVVDVSELEDEDEELANLDFFQVIVDSMLRWSTTHGSHFKASCRHVVDRLVRKFGLEEVKNRVPEHHQPLITNIRKRRERALRKAAANKDDTNATSNSSANVGGGNKRSGNDDEASDSDSDEENDNLPDILKELVMSRPRSMDALQLSGDGMLMDDAYETESVFPVKKDKRRVHFDLDKTGRLKIQHEPTRAASAPSHESAFLESLTSKDSHRVSANGRRIKFANTLTRGVERDDDHHGEQIEGGKKSKWKPNDAAGSKRKHVAVGGGDDAGIATGIAYKGKKAKGDIKRAGRVEPYAYIPLHAKLMAGGKNHKKRK